METSINFECDEAERKAFEALAGYKFQMFGYWAAIWVHMNRLRAKPKPSPFAATVRLARGELGKRGLWPRRGKAVRA